MSRAPESAVMNTYLIRRRDVADTANGLDAALTRLHLFEERGTLPVRWLRSYALRESSGGFGLACVFGAESAQTLLEHAGATRLPAEEVLRVALTHVETSFAPHLAHLIRRRPAWRDAAGARRAAQRARRIAASPTLASHLVWLRSYAVVEDDGSLGSYCLYQATDSRLLAEHAERAGMPAAEITPVLGRIVFRDEPLERPAAPSAGAVLSNPPFNPRKETP